LSLTSLAITVGDSVIAYGNFIQAVVNFLIVAFVVFLIVRSINKMKKPAPSPALAETPADIKLLTEIRDLLKK
jgi:large conductance mechanosensitive channel